MRILVIDTVHEALCHGLKKAGFEVELLPKSDLSLLSERLSSFDGLILRSGAIIDRALIDAHPQLQFIGRVGAGLEHIDVEYARSKGVAVLSSPEGNRQAVAEHALASLLTLMNNIHTSDREVRRGMWIRKENEGDELEGKTVAVIGHGNTGSAFGKILSGFEVRRIAYDKYKKGFGTSAVEEVSMEEVFASADVVSLHLPLTEETQFLGSKQWFERFQKPIYLINTSRGPIVRTKDLLEALDNGKVKGACLDVLEYETETLKMPALEELPREAESIMRHPRVLLTPHIAGLTSQSYEKLSSVLAEKIIERFKPA